MVFNGVIFPNHQTNNNSINTLKLGQIQVRNFSVSGGNASTSVAWIEIIVKLSCAKEDSGNSGLEFGFNKISKSREMANTMCFVVV